MRKLMSLVSAFVMLASMVAFGASAHAAPVGNVTQYPGDLPSAAATEIVGLIYRDFNANGTKEVQEPGFTGSVTGADTVLVEAYDDSNTVISSATTGTDGVFTITGLTAGTPYRLEVSGLPSYLEAGASTSGGAESLTTFATPGEADVLIGVNAPGDYCQSTDQLDMAVPCFINGDPLGGGDAGTGDAFVTFDYAGTATDQYTLASDIGATWGVAYNPEQDVYYTAATIKRHSGFGPSGIGGIYAIDPADGSATAFATVAGLTDVTRDLDPDSSTPNADADAFAAVAKMGLGDIDFDVATSTLYVMNLEAKQVEVFTVDAAGAATAGTAIPVPDPGCVAGEHRPFAVEVQDGSIAVGTVCDASSGADTDLTSFIQVYDGAAWSNLLEYDNLAGNREYVGYNPPTDQAFGDYGPWSDDPAVVVNNPTSTPFSLVQYHQPILSDIEFDNDGSAIIAFMDRSAHQVGFLNNDVNGNYSEGIAISSGDIVRACFDITTGTYVVEGDGPACLQTSSGGDSPSGDVPEFYNGDRFDTGATWEHYETSYGGIALIPGQDEVVMTAMDPDGTYDSGGVSWLSNTTGEQLRGLELYATPFSLGSTASTFSKSSGIGDIEAACKAAPVEIGNVVWVDVDGDGVYDPSETPIPGVTVELLDAGGAVVATAVTDANGNYIFTNHPYDHPNAWMSTDADPDATDSSGIVPGGINRNADYTVRIDTTQSAITTPGYFLTTPDAGTNDVHDSDGQPSGDYAIAAVTTGGPGQNDHTIDFGFTQVETYSIGNQVWEDVDNDGQIEAGEPLLENIWVYLFEDTDGDGVPDDTNMDGMFDENDAVRPVQMTDVDGQYLFAGLLPENYIVGIPPLEFNAGQPLNGYASSDPTETDPNDDSDLNDNGIVDASGWILSGSVDLSGSEPLAEDPDNDPNTDDENENLTVDFGFYQLPEVYSIGNQVWEDVDNDGQIDLGEPMLENIWVYLFSDNDNDGNPDDANMDGVVTEADAVVPFTMTDADGEYLFDNLPEGNYIVGIPPIEFVAGGPLQGMGSSDPTEADPNDDTDLNDNGIPDPSGWVFSGTVDLSGSEPLAEDPDNDPNTDDENENLTVDFGFYTLPTYSLGNQVWFDADNDGLIDEGETPIENVWVEVFTDIDGDGLPDDTNMDGVIDDSDAFETTGTDADGFYLFTDLPEGTYIVGIPPMEWDPDGPLYGLLSSDPTSADANDDVDNNDDGAPGPYGYVWSTPIDLLGGEPLGEDPDNDPDTDDASENLTVDFGFYQPIFDLALFKQLDDGTNLAEVERGDAVTFVITIVNQGDVSAYEPSIVDYVPDGLVLADPDWTLESDGTATYVLSGITLDAGEQIEVPITFTIGDNAAGTITNLAEISSATPVDELGEVVVMPNGAVLPDIDSIPDAVNGDALIDDEISLTAAAGDEDDHDQAQITLPGTLALTGASTGLIATTGAGLLAAGYALTRRRRESLA